MHDFLLSKRLCNGALLTTHDPLHHIASSKAAVITLKVIQCIVYCDRKGYLGKGMLACLEEDWCSRRAFTTSLAMEMRDFSSAADFSLESTPDMTSAVNCSG